VRDDLRAASEEGMESAKDLRDEVTKSVAALAETLRRRKHQKENLNQAMRRVLPGLSGGAGVLESAFDHHSPIAVPPRARARTGANPFDRINYLRAIH